MTIFFKGIFAGRDDLVDSLSDRVATFVASEESNVIVLRGDAGMGKTKALIEFSKMLREEYLSKDLSLPAFEVQTAKNDPAQAFDRVPSRRDTEGSAATSGISPIVETSAFDLFRLIEISSDSFKARGQYAAWQSALCSLLEIDPMTMTSVEQRTRVESVLSATSQQEAASERKASDTFQRNSVVKDERKTSVVSAGSSVMGDNENAVRYQGPFAELLPLLNVPLPSLRYSETVVTTQVCFRRSTDHRRC